VKHEQIEKTVMSQTEVWADKLQSDKITKTEKKSNEKKNVISKSRYPWNQSEGVPRVYKGYRI